MESVLSATVITYMADPKLGALVAVLAGERPSQKNWDKPISTYLWYLALGSLGHSIEVEGSCDDVGNMTTS